MSDEVLVNGDRVYVSDHSIGSALREKDERRFFGMTTTGQFAVESLSGGSYSWKYAVKVRAPQYIPFTLDTLPKQHIMARIKGGEVGLDVVGRCPANVYFAGFNLSYDRLIETREMSLDYGETWQPAGELV